MAEDAERAVITRDEAIAWRTLLKLCPELLHEQNHMQLAGRSTVTGQVALNGWLQEVQQEQGQRKAFFECAFKIPLAK